MADYLVKFDSAFNAVLNAFTLKARSMNNTPKTQMAFRGLLKSDVQDRHDEVRKAVESLSKLVYVGSKDLKNDLDTGKKQILAFKPVKEAYVSGLNHALKGSIPQDSGFPTDLKTLAPDVYRLTKVLQTELEAISARAVMDWEQFDKQEKANEIQEKGQQKAAAAKNEEEKKRREDRTNAKMALLTFAPKLKSALAKGMAAVQKIKANPIPKTYNDEMNNAGRDVSQNILNIQKWRNDPKILKIDSVKSMPDPGNIVQRIAEFGNGTRRTVRADATKDTVLAELKLYSAVLKDIDRVYADFMNGKLASKLDH